MGAAGAWRGQGREEWTNGTFSTYDYTRMTLLITAPCQSGSLSLYWCGLSSGAAICLQNIATQYNTKNCRATKNIIYLSPGWFMPQYPGSATLCSLQPVPIWPWSVPLRRKREGLQGTKVTGWQHISSLTERDFRHELFSDVCDFTNERGLWRNK